MSRSWLVLLVLVSLLASCPRGVPDASREVRGQADAGFTEEQRLTVQVDRIDAETEAVVRAIDEALWQHWMNDAPLELSKISAAHPALFSKETIDVLRRARQANVEPVRARHLESWLVGELLARALTRETEAIASLEAGATFPLDGKEVPWRELPRLLVIERSAVRRRALWSASLSTVSRLDVLLAHREQVAKEALAAYDLPSTDAFEAEAREINLEQVGIQARVLLEATDPLWKQTIKALADAELKLPVEALTRADLPRLIKSSPAVDGAFPKAQVAHQATQTLDGMGLGGSQGLTFELSDAPKKKPLPLTVALGPGDVRVSYKPAGGLRDLVQLLGEVGTAVALHSAKTGHSSTDRLGDPSRALTLSMLFMGLPADTEWLAARGVPQPLHAEILAAVQAHRLFVLRRSCLLVLLHLEAEGLPDGEARAKEAELAARVLMMKVPAEEGVRLRLELDDSLRAATTLKAMELAALERASLPAGWWSSPGVVQGLVGRWAPGTARPPWTAQEQEQGLSALLRSFGIVASSDLAPATVDGPDAGQP